MILSKRMAEITGREVPQSRRADILRAYSELDERIFEGQDLNRIAAAVLILFLEGFDLGAIVHEAEDDWRDLLMSSDLGGDDWPEVLLRRFGVNFAEPDGVA